jgi:CBS domain-containing protein
MLDDSTVTAGDIMTTDVAVAHPETPLLSAVRVMVQRRISGMPVVDDAGAIVGMLSEGDLVRWHEGLGEKQINRLNMLADGYELAKEFLDVVEAEHNKVRAAMAQGAITVTESTPAREIATLMHKQHIKRVPVLRDGAIVGIVARSDLVAALYRKLSETRGSAS